MKKALILIFLLTGLYYPSKAQDSYITYNNDTEKALLSSAQTPDDLIKLALLSDLSESEMNLVYTKFTDDISKLKLEGGKGHISDSRLKQIYQALHDKFMGQFDVNAHFSDLLISGRYQCAPASVLYAYVLEKLNIPYQIKQFPGHVYVIAEPDANKISFDTIDPLKGFYVINDESKMKDVNEFIKDKYLEQSYVNSEGVERAFDDFYYGKEDISLKEAVGILYFNRGNDEMNANKATEAYSDIAKSDILFPEKKNQFFENELMLDMVNTFKYNDLKDWITLTNLANKPNATDDTKKYLQYQFENMLSEKLIKAGQKDKVDAVYTYLSANLTDADLKTQVEEDYYYQNAEYEFILTNYDDALTYMEKDYAINPNNPLVSSQFAQMVAQKFAGNITTSKMILLDNYVTRYPGLEKNQTIVSLYIFDITFLGNMAFAKDDGTAGEKYIQQLTHLLDANPEHSDKYNFQIASIFGAASAYYYRKKEKPKCIVVLNAGLKYVPDSELLLRKLKNDSQ